MITTLYFGGISHGVNFKEPGHHSIIGTGGHGAKLGRRIMDRAALREFIDIPFYFEAKVHWVWRRQSIARQDTINLSIC